MVYGRDGTLHLVLKERGYCMGLSLGSPFGAHPHGLNIAGSIGEGYEPSKTLAIDAGSGDTTSKLIWKLLR